MRHQAHLWFNFVLVGLVLGPAVTLGSTSVSHSTRPIDLTIRNFDQLTSEGVWFIDIYAPWCTHCKQLEPIWEKVAEALHYDGINVAKINAVEEQLLSRRFVLEGYPTLVLMKDGQSFVFDKPQRSFDTMVDFARKSHVNSATLPWYGSPNSPFGLAQGQLIRGMISAADFYALLVARGIPAPAIIAGAVVVPILTCLMLLCTVDSYLTISLRSSAQQRQQQQQQQQQQHQQSDAQQQPAAEAPRQEAAAAAGAVRHPHQE